MASPYEAFGESVTVLSPEAAKRKSPGRVDSSLFHAGLLGLLAMLFVGRVVAQLIQYFRPVDVLPRFEQWQSGALPYGILVVLQLALVAGQVRVVGAVSRGQRLLRREWRRMISAFAVIYLAVMVFRLIAGLTFATGGGWLDARLPTVFHLVLAGFLLLWMHHESGGWEGVASAGRTAAGAKAPGATRVLLERPSEPSTSL